MAAPASRVYVVSITRVAFTTAITIMQIKAGATVPLQIIRCELGQTASTTSTQQAIQLNRKSAAATVTSFTPKLCGPSTDPAASSVGGTAATGITGTAEGTDGDILKQGVFNFLNGWLYLPTPKEYPFVNAATIVALLFPTTPTITLTADTHYEELA